MSEGGKRAAAIAVVAAVALTAGCGGSSRLSKPDYELKLRAAGTELLTSVTSAGLCEEDTGTEAETWQQTARSGEGDLKALASNADSIQKSTEKAADEIDSLRPPKDAEADNQAIADTLHRGADEVFGQIKEAAESGNNEKVRESYAHGLNVAEAADHAVADLKKRGYDIGPFGSDGLWC